MDKIVFQSEDLQRQYDKRYEELRKIAESPALKTEILWDKTAAKYAETIARAASHGRGRASEGCSNTAGQAAADFFGEVHEP